ncbi:MAG TPA: hypothetical protein VFO01_06795 [Trebonia sp.]|nr:hypothetical protein [Trebonia sp.]
MPSGQPRGAAFLDLDEQGGAAGLGDFPAAFQDLQDTRTRAPEISAGRRAPPFRKPNPQRMISQTQGLARAHLTAVPGRPGQGGRRGQRTSV